MADTNSDLSEVTNALNRLAMAMEQLPARYDVIQRANRRLRVAVVLLALSLLGGMALGAFVSAERLLDRVLQPKLADLDPERAAAERQRLLGMLSKEDQARALAFERNIQWVHQYRNTLPDLDAGAAVTFFLSSMSSSVEVVPAMYAQVRAMQDEMRAINEQMRSMNEKMQSLPVLTTEVQGMNVKMGALPIMATDVQGMHAQMSVMAAGMDSTMGRAGRMFPFSW